MERKKYCSAAFLDVSQAFDKVWHTGLLFKLRNILPINYFCIIKSYLQNRTYLVRHLNEETPLFTINAGVPQGSVLGPLLYVIYTHDLPAMNDTMIATFADDTVILASHADPAIASLRLQESLNHLQTWLEHWNIRVNETKSAHVTFTNRRGICPAVTLNGRHIPQSNDAKYLGMHLDSRLTWKKHLLTKRVQLGLILHKLYWLAGRKSKLSITNKLLIYKAILKPVWSYGIQLWGTASASNIAIMERFKSKVLRMIVDAPWYVPNKVIAHDLQIPAIKDVIKSESISYRKRLESHPNLLARQLYSHNLERRLKRHYPRDAMSRF